MVSPKQKTRNKTSKEKTADRPIKAQEIRYQSVLLEEMRGQFQAVAEQAAASQEFLGQRIDNLGKEFRGEIDGVKTGLKFLNTKIDEVEGRLSTKIDGVEHRLNIKIEGLDIKIDEVEKRLDAKIDGVEHRLSEKIDGIGEKVVRHDKEIVFLKTAIGRN